MINQLKVAIVKARCSRTTRSFGIRFDQSAASWLANWSFPFGDENVNRPESEAIHVDGHFAIGASYPGCPDCKAASFFRCGCGKVGCWDGKSPTVTCPWCNQFGTLAGTMDFLNVSEDC